MKNVASYGNRNKLLIRNQVTGKKKSEIFVSEEKMYNFAALNFKLKTP